MEGSLDAPTTLFFDRDVGITLPKALDLLRLPTHVEYHQKHFAIDARDDDWMPTVGGWGWTLIGHDSRHHQEDSEVAAIKQHRIGCFYLWGAEALRWEKMRLLPARLRETFWMPRPRPLGHSSTESPRRAALRQLLSHSDRIPNMAIIYSTSEARTRFYEIIRHVVTAGRSPSPTGESRSPKSVPRKDLRR